VSVVLTVLYLVAAAAAGICVLGFVEALTLPEAIAGGVAAGAVLSAAATLLLASILGMSVAVVFAGVALVLALTGIAGWLTKRDLPVHLRTLAARVRRRDFGLRWPLLTLAVTVIFGFIFAHAIVDSGGDLRAGYPTVWADWQQHLSTQSAFVVGGNIFPHNSLYAGTPLLYPFLSDFHAAELNELGLGPGAALALASLLMTVSLCILLVCVAIRLRAKFAAGVLAVVVIFVGGGFGFTGALADSCARQQLPATLADTTTFTNTTDAQLGCSIGDVVTHPTALSAALHGLPGLIAHQPRAYDGLPVDQPYCPVSNCDANYFSAVTNTQWYTPLLAWWLPQRPMAYGTAIFLLAVVIALAIRQSKERQWHAAVVGAVLVGLLPWIHVHAFLALIMAAPFLLLWRRRLEWLVLAGGGALLAAPRLLMIAAGPHGSAASGNAFPSTQLGWLSGVAGNGAAASTTPSDLVLGPFKLLFNGTWWGFWLGNLGLVVPLVLISAVVLLGTLPAVARPVRSGAGKVVAWLGRDAAIFALCMSVVFLAANIVVFQSWKWDNTKLFAYWYIGPAILIGSAVTNVWGNWWRNILAGVAYATVVLTGAIVVVGIPWASYKNGTFDTARFHVADAAERTMAQQLIAKTSPGSIFVTTREPDDPVATIAGRTTLMGFYGWLWSYGIDFGEPPNDRIDDVAAILRGCASIPEGECRVWSLIKRYGVSYVEIDAASNPADSTGNSADPGWWANQGLKVVASAGSRVVYDVRGHG
jgi:hypothetical protein